MAEDSQDAQFEEYKQQQRETFSERNGESVVQDDVYQALDGGDTRANSSTSLHRGSFSSPYEGHGLWHRVKTSLSTCCHSFSVKLSSLWNYLCVRFTELTTPESVALVLLMTFLISASFFSIFALF